MANFVLGRPLVGLPVAVRSECHPRATDLAASEIGKHIKIGNDKALSGGEASRTDEARGEREAKGGRKSKEMSKGAAGTGRMTRTRKRISSRKIKKNSLKASDITYGRSEVKSF